MNEDRGYMTAKILVEITWIDEYTKFVNLKKDDNMNTLKIHQKRKLWIPTLVFINAVENKIGSFVDDLSTGKMRILDEDKNGTFAGLFEARNYKVFKGDEV